MMGWVVRFDRWCCGCSIAVGIGGIGDSLSIMKYSGRDSSMRLGVMLSSHDVTEARKVKRK